MSKWIRVTDEINIIKRNTKGVVFLNSAAIYGASCIFLPKRAMLKVAIELLRRCGFRNPTITGNNGKSLFLRGSAYRAQSATDDATRCQRCDLGNVPLCYERFPCDAHTRRDKRHIVWKKEVE